MQHFWIVQTNDGYNVNAISYHSSKFGAEYQCAHFMNDEISDDNAFEAAKFQIVKRELEL